VIAEDMNRDTTLRGDVIFIGSFVYITKGLPVFIDYQLERLRYNPLDLRVLYTKGKVSFLFEKPTDGYDHADDGYRED